MTASDTIVALRAPRDETRMTQGQIIAVLLAVLIAGLDGYDVQSMSFVAPVIGKAWHVDKAVLGLALGSSLFGMAGGSLLLSPFADLFGRRPMVLAGLMLVTLGALLSGLSQTVGELAASRAVTGLGIGVIITLTTALAAEFATPRRRALAVAATTVTLALGGVVGGLTAAAILRSHSWTWVFGCGAVAGAVLLIAAWAGLPETPSFLIDRQPKEALRRLNRALSQLGLAPAASLPVKSQAKRASYRALFAPGTVGSTIRFAVVYMLITTAAYYMISWLPQLVADAGFKPSTGGLVSAASSLVGIASGLIFGALAARIGPMRLASVAMVGFGLALACLGYAPATLPMLILAASACGFFLSASTAVFYATMTETFPPLMRVSGIGLVLGFGRLLSGFGPIVAGAMFAAGLTRSGVSLVFAGAAVAGGLLLMLGARKPAPPA